MNLLSVQDRQQFMSEVEMNKALLSPGDKLTAAGEDFTVEVVTEDGFTTACGDAFCFDSLQLCWEVKSAAKQWEMVRLNRDNSAYPRWMTWNDYKTAFV